MCKFWRRELWFDHNRSGSYLFREHLEDPSCSISIWLWTEDGYGLTGASRLLWAFKCGNVLGSKRQVRYATRDDAVVRAQDLSPERMLKKGREWVATCCDSHKHCGIKNDGEEHFLPTRLLDVGVLGQQSVRLVSSEQIRETDGTSYVTLSYCRGDLGNIGGLTEINLAEHNILVDSLPLTIQDAVKVTQACGIRYLWVDALCITQTEMESHWQRELADMGKIYKHSVFTIAASGARTISDGLFSCMAAACWPVQNFHIPLQENPKKWDKGFNFDAIMPDWTASVERSPLSTRGWVLQERILAAKTLFWTEEGVFWQCNELMTSIYGPMEARTQTNYPTLQDIAAKIKDPERHQDNVMAWTALVEKYTHKVLSVSTDRLPAITGLATDLSMLSGVKYSMGVFANNIQQELSWVASLGSEATVQPGARLPDIPSWSWGSSDQAIVFRNPPSLRHKMGHAELVTELTLNGRCVNARACIGSVRVLKSIQASPECDSGSRVFSQPSYTFERSSRQSNCRPTSQGITARIFFDTALDALPGEGGTVLCIWWSQWTQAPDLHDPGSDRVEAIETPAVAPVDSEENPFRTAGGWYQVKGDDLPKEDGESEDVVKVTGALVVAPVEGEENTYRRRGWLEVEGDDELLEEEWEPRNITLV
ncbi:hypothetical protein OPT61_g6359 [Boeremia exigua]|uniref:Uncharacterized protein n=1 Tax=Boeremia exigua TaxID=749465 RepID=A0ACC2I6Y4_9PLEO|nr:hypothetical protein OPT61_g6359 [Boeremia exigua]